MSFRPPLLVLIVIEHNRTQQEHIKSIEIDFSVSSLLDVKQGQNKEGKTVLYLVFQYMETDLKKYIRSFRNVGDNVPPHIVKSLMYLLCKGVAFCHGHGVIHRGLKPHNLLMDKKSLVLKIADLGLARAFTVPIKKYTHEILTLWYRAPEVLLGATHYSCGVDMWSVGCIFAELVNNQALFMGDSELQQLLHIFRFDTDLKEYQNLITRTMYDKRLDSGRGTLLHLCDDVIQQEVKEVIIFFFCAEEIW